MDKDEFDNRASRLEDIGKVIEKLPAEIRSEAFGFLRGYVSGQNPTKSATTRHAVDNDAVDSAGDDTTLFSQFDHDKPSDNVRLIAAELFRQYGSEPFSVDEINATAADAGITVPTRVDMTLRAALENGKHLFVGVGSGKFKPTVHGEAYLKSTYSVKKGTAKRPEVAK